MEAVVLKCPSCGGDVTFSAEESELKCEFCGTVFEPDKEETKVIEHDFAEFLTKLSDDSESIESMVADCRSCGAQIMFAENDLVEDCPYCGTPVVNEGHKKRVLCPQYMLAFGITESKASTCFKEWKNSQWFAPSAFNRESRQGRLHGVYMPFWTFDYNAMTDYTGKRGDDRMVTRIGFDGKLHTEIKTCWHHVSGRVFNAFDNVLVYASNTLTEKLVAELEPWDLDNLQKFDFDKLRGFDGETYSVCLEDGFVHSTEMISKVIENTIRADIGGDYQHVYQMDKQYDAIKFKYIMLPLWVSNFKFKNKTYQYYVNARTGEVQGERPWSIVKITLAVLAVLVLNVGLYYAATH